VSGKVKYYGGHRPENDEHTKTFGFATSMDATHLLVGVVAGAISLGLAELVEVGSGLGCLIDLPQQEGSRATGMR